MRSTIDASAFFAAVRSGTLSPGKYRLTGELPPSKAVSEHKTAAAIKGLSVDVNMRLAEVRKRS